MFAIRYNKIALSTRNLRDRSSVTTIYTAADNIISGVIVGMLISSILYYRMLVNDTTGNNWRMMVNITAIIAIPLMFVEYFYTRERVTEENMDTNRKSDGEVARTPIKEQMKDLVSNKYWLLSQVIILVGMITVQMQGTNIRTNYCQWVLGANAENNLQIMYMAVAMAPMGFGIALIFPLVKKLGARKLVMAGGLISAICGLFCMLFPTNIGVAFAGSFIFSFGMNVIHQKLDFYAFNVYNSNNYNDGPDRINPLVYPGQPRTAMGWPITPEVMYWADLC